jgi:methionyl-tRNA formyltransferase
MAAVNLIFMGTAELSCASLAALLADARFRVAAVVTQPDKPKGRNLAPQPSPVKVLALQSQVPVLQPQRARDETFLAQLQSFAPDLIIVVAYGQILPPAILDLPRHGCLNVHTSLLPKYRGAAPIQWAIANGDSETGVTIMKMDPGLDTGPILSQRRTPIDSGDDSQSLHDRLARLGADLLVQTIPGYLAGDLLPQPQPATGSTYAAKINKEDGRIIWSQPARQIWNRFRAFTPWPGAFTFYGAQDKAVLLKIRGARVVERPGVPGEILQADRDGIIVGCGQQALQITDLQREGGRALTAREFLAGHPLRVGEKLG